MKTERPSGWAWRWIAVATVLLVCLLTVILLVKRAPQEHLAIRTEPGSAPLQANPPRVQAHANVDVPRAAAPTPAPAVIDDLCGVNGPDRKRAGNETLDQHMARLTQRAIRRWKEALAASEDPRRQAIGLALTDTKPDAHISTPEERIPGNEPSKDTPINNKLVLLATESGDPAIYSLAIGQCRDATNDMASGPCQGLSWEQWADIDPDDGMPWLWIAAKADHAGNQQEVEEALAKASTAPRIDGYWSTLSAVALGALPSDSAPLEKAVAGADVTSIPAVGTPFAIISLCSASAIQQTRRKQECSAIAATLAKQGSMLIDLVMASSLADRLGFPPETRAVLSAEAKRARAAVSKSFPWSFPLEGSKFGCDTLLAYDRFVDVLRADGNERAALLAIAAPVR